MNKLAAVKRELWKRGEFAELGFFPKQVEALKSLKWNADITEFLYGGAAGGGKSFVGMAWLMMNAACYPNTNWFLGRHKKVQIYDANIQTTLPKVCKKLGLVEGEDFTVNRNSGRIIFKNGSNILFIEMSLRPGDDKDFDRYGSLEFTGGVIEEAAGIPFEAYNVIRQRIGRQLNEELGILEKVLIVSNPSKNWLYSLFYKPFQKRTIKPFRGFLQSLVDENIYAGNYVRILDNLTGKEYERKRMGNWEFEDDPSILINFDAMDDMLTNDFDFIYKDKERYASADIALYGSDKLIIGTWQGWKLINLVVKDKCGSKEAVDILKTVTRDNNVRRSNVVYDSDGIGMYLRGYFSGGKSFVNGGKPIKIPLDPSNYKNLRSQCWYGLANQINNRDIWTPPEILGEHREYLFEELQAIKDWKADRDGKKEVIPKKEIKQAISRSPDYGDMMMMRYFFDLKQSWSSYA